MTDSAYRVDLSVACKLAEQEPVVRTESESAVVLLDEPQPESVLRERIE